MLNLKIKNKIYLYMTIISFLISAILYGISLYLSWCGTMIIGLNIFLPTVLVGLICYISSRNKFKHLKITKNINIILNAFIIIFIQIFICGFFTFFFSDFYEKDVTQIKDYQHALKSINNQSRIKHFPTEIPLKAKNVQLYKSSNNWFGSEEIFLKFNIDKPYIEETLSKYKFQKIEGPYNDDSLYEYNFRVLGSYQLEKKGYKASIISLSNEPHNNYSYGIAVNEQTNGILFYYSYPD